MLDGAQQFCYNKGMEDVKQIISENLVALRKHYKLTQVELSKKINYSDKAISRWENGEALPDVVSLQALSEIYNVDVGYFFKRHDGDKPKINKTRQQKLNEIAVEFLSICVVWVLVTVMFVYLKIIYGYIFWQGFLWAIPASLLVAIIYNRKWGNKKWLIYLNSSFIWTFITCIYCQLIEQNLWLIFLIGIPIQASIIAASFIKKKE